MTPSSFLFKIFGGIIFPLLFLTAACMRPDKIPKPKNLIAEDTYINLLVEMQHIKTYRDAHPDSVRADSLKAIVYQKYAVNEEQFLASHQYYQKHIDDQILRAEEVIRRLEMEEQRFKTHIDSIQAEFAKQDSLANQDSVSMQ